MIFRFSPKTVLSVLIILFAFGCVMTFSFHLSQQINIRKSEPDRSIDSLVTTVAPTPSPSATPTLTSRPAITIRHPTNSTSKYFQPSSLSKPTKQPIPKYYSSDILNVPNYYSTGDSYSGYSSGGTVHVRGYYRKNGTYVQSYTRRSPRR